MSELEEKFYNWLMLNYCVPIKPEKIAHDLAKIAEKDYERINNARKSSIDYSIKLQKENEEIRELNKAQVLENAKIRVDIAELKKQNKLMNWAINEMGYEIECHKKQIEDNK